MWSRILQQELRVPAQGQFDAALFVGRLVDGEDQLDGLAGLAAVNRGIGAGLDCVNHVLKLPLVAFVADGLGGG